VQVMLPEPVPAMEKPADKALPPAADALIPELTSTLIHGTPPLDHAERLFNESTFFGAGEPARPRLIPSAENAPPGGMSDALRVVLEGAGLPHKQLPVAESERMLRDGGAILRAAVEGIMMLLLARAEMRKEFEAEERTMVAARDNNPLKLMADPQEAMEFLFDTNERSGGFLTPVQAVGDAFEDMRAHEAALIAGMRAAILGSLKRFDPATLEEDLGKAAGGLGLNKKAKLWDLFASYQQKLARDAEEDFNKVFGRDFMGSYMEQVRKLKKK
jgi:type VI secretion system FHA domain protein